MWHVLHRLNLSWALLLFLTLREYAYLRFRNVLPCRDKYWSVPLVIFRTLYGIYVRPILDNAIPCSADLEANASIRFRISERGIIEFPISMVRMVDWTGSSVPINIKRVGIKKNSKSITLTYSLLCVWKNRNSRGNKFRVKDREYWEYGFSHQSHSTSNQHKSWRDHFGFQWDFVNLWSLMSEC